VWGGVTAESLETSQSFLGFQQGARIETVKVRFGEWTFDEPARQVRRGAEVVHLSTKAFDLLKLLIDARPRVVSKAELQDSLWRDVFVSEANLFTLVSEIRSALEDDARDARFVRTVHGVGYAFSGHAVAVDEQPAGSPMTGFALVWDSHHVGIGQGESVVGRDSDLPVCLDSPTVSRRHARIVIAGEEAILEDLGSKNGTYLNNQRLVSAARLKHGDQIRFGGILCSFRAVMVGKSTETQS
jgi:DNA-binding winged helix-turn-helix (wHTH) protein